MQSKHPKILSLILDNYRQDGLINENCLNVGILNNRMCRVIEFEDLPVTQMIITNIGSTAFPRYEYAFPLYYFSDHLSSEVSNFIDLIKINRIKKVTSIKSIPGSDLYLISDLVKAKIITEIW